MSLPRKSILFKNNQRDQDDRGDILSIVDEAVNNVSIISCNPGALRSNHYHHTDFRHSFLDFSYHYS